MKMVWGDSFWRALGSNDPHDRESDMAWTFLLLMTVWFIVCGVIIGVLVSM